jgi:TetR/AcrR family transcriptional repressor of lmrAB and yxaGH operons
MGRTTDTRSRMVRTTAELLQRQGFHATGFAQILAESDAPRGSIYFHFPQGKQELAVEALRLAGARISRVIQRAAAAAGDAGELVDRVVGALAAGLERSGYTEGCPVATVGLETASSMEPLRRACDEVYADWQRLLAQALTARGVEPERAATLATMVITAVEGALLLARVRQDQAPLQLVAAELRRLVTA